MKFSLNSFLTITIISYFIMRTEGIAHHIPSIWAIPLLIIFLISITFILKFKKSEKLKLLQESKWIIISLIILSIFKLLKYGNFRLDTLFLYLLFSIPFYVIGYYWGLKNDNKYFRNIVVSYFIFLSLFMLTKLFQIKSFGSIQREYIETLFYGGNSSGGLIFFFPFTVFVTIITFSFFIEKKRNNTGKRFIMVILFSTSILFFIISTFASSVFLILITGITYYITKANSKNKLKVLIIIPIIGTLTYGVIYLLGSGIIGNFGPITNKANGVLLLLSSGKLFDVDVLNIITSNRWTAMQYSIEQFLNSPIYGHGAYLESVKGMLGNINKYSTVAGEHNFMFDILAFFGLFGIPIILILVKFVKDAFKYYHVKSLNRKEKRTALIFASLMVGVLFSNIFNSWFLFSSFDNFIFLSSGFFLGKFYYVKNNTIYNNL